MGCVLVGAFVPTNHADAFSANPKGLNLYNAEDYENRNHPPIITIGVDGVAGYSIYQNGEGDGAEVALDEFGGHEHDDYGYHYHSRPEDAVADTGGVDYTAHQLPPLGAWSGRINDIPEFWNGTRPNTMGAEASGWGRIIECCCRSDFCPMCALRLAQKSFHDITKNINLPR